MKIVTDLERIGDQAVNIAPARARAEPASRSSSRYIDLPRMAELAQEMVQGEPGRLRAPATPSWPARCCAEDDEVDALKEQIFRELLTFMMEDARTIPRAHPARS